MLGLEPGDVVLAIRFLVLHQAEADEGVHLVAVAPDILVELFDPAHIGIGLVLHHARVRLKPPQQAIEQGEAFGIGMERGVLRKGYEAAIGTHRRRIAGRYGRAPLAMREQIATTSRFDPGDPIGRHVALDQRPRPLAPELEIVRLGQLDHVICAELHGLERSRLSHAANSSSCSVLGASMVLRSARSVSRVGRQSTVQMNGRTLVID